MYPRVLLGGFLDAHTTYNVIGQLIEYQNYLVADWKAHHL